MQATVSSIRRALVSKGWSGKPTQRKAKEQNAELRELYLHKLSDCESYHLVYVTNLDVISGLPTDRLVTTRCSTKTSIAVPL
jgi:hypothetical protein